MPLPTSLARTTGGLALLGATTTAYAVWEARQFTLRRVEVPLLPPGHRPLRVLHLSDLHVTPHQRAKLDWIRGLAALEPDLVVDTGDNLAHRRAGPAVVDALGDLLGVPGVFVLGSNDYFEPRPRNPFLYLLPDTGKRHISVPQLDWRGFTRELTDAGWLDLGNATGRLTVGDTTFAFAGVDDPHLEYDDLAAVAEPAPDDADVRLAVAHAPYLRVLDHFAARGWDAVLAGHTHGGQVCVPGYGALTTNCDLDTRRAKGLSRHGEAWLHVSAGLGTSPYAQIRIACRPEATLLTLVPR